MEIAGRGIALRDFTMGDLPARMRWETQETEWKLWDAPWERLARDEARQTAHIEELRTLLHARARLNMSLSEAEPRRGFEIYSLSPRQNIGWVSSYFLAEDWTVSETETERAAVGIDIPPPDCRGKGHGKAALGQFVAYLLETGRREVYTQTWSGNKAMVLLANSLGFEPFHRRPNLREVDGERFDGLTFKLNIDKFEEIWNR